LSHGEATDAVSVACDRDGETLAIGLKPQFGGGNEFVAQIWNRKRREAAVATVGGHGSSVDAVALSPDGRWLASGGALESEILVRNRADLTANATRVATKHGQVRALAFSPDSRLLAWGESDGWIGLAAADGGFSHVGGFADHRDPIRALVFGNDLLESAGEGGEIVIRSVIDDSLLKRFAGHRGEVHGLAFVPANATIVSAGDDGTVRLWNLDPQSGDPTVLTKPGERFRSVAVSPDGKHIVAGAASGNIFVWPTTETLADAMCQLVSRNLDCAEWSRFIGEGIAYAPTCPAHPSPNCLPSR
jgi:WD40 repeat protein